jgi:heme/copper-type cytochrome/quinol oxidase subunit 3
VTTTAARIARRRDLERSGEEVFCFTVVIGLCFVIIFYCIFNRLHHWDLLWGRATTLGAARSPFPVFKLFPFDRTIKH